MRSNESFDGSEVKEEEGVCEAKAVYDLGNRTGISCELINSKP